MKKLENTNPVSSTLCYNMRHLLEVFAASSGAVASASAASVASTAVLLCSVDSSELEVVVATSVLADDGSCGSET